MVLEFHLVKYELASAALKFAKAIAFPIYTGLIAFLYWCYTKLKSYVKSLFSLGKIDQPLGIKKYIEDIRFDLQVVVGAFEDFVGAFEEVRSIWTVLTSAMVKEFEKKDEAKEILSCVRKGISDLATLVVEKERKNVIEESNDSLKKELKKLSDFHDKQSVVLFSSIIRVEELLRVRVGVLLKKLYCHFDLWTSAVLFYY